MRVKRLTTWLVLGIAVAYAYARRRRSRLMRRAVSRGTPAEIDPSTLGLGGEEGDLFVEAISAWDAEIEPELEVGVTEPMPLIPGGVRVDPDTVSIEDIAPSESARPDAYGDRRAPLGVGDLYGVHVVPAEDRELLDDDRAQDEGENWLEHLGASATELGPEAEREVDIVDDSDVHTGHHKTATTDTPVADRGSGGPGGL